MFEAHRHMWRIAGASPTMIGFECACGKSRLILKAVFWYTPVPWFLGRDV